ncbi:sugar phosphate isomerase/epimerase family protein [Desertivirga xinjiangensis]|uniref:sugar phosphate isomerase/epimerase family protein n=1 Tax=Desertivirga xinjiangensis TaxID=539206 RepID=UPI00210CC89D|nr:TIM barrel protein [Pedobacter xinjiangensis]
MIELKKNLGVKGVLLTVLSLFMGCGAIYKGKDHKSRNSIYSKDNLVAWCIVPYDIKERDPEQRAQMLNDLGITKLAYDWREKHIPTFDKEIQTLKKHRIHLQAFWMYSGPDPEKEGNLKLILDALKRNNTKTEIWFMVGGIDLSKMSQEEKIRAISKPVKYIAKEAAKIGCKVALYNHGGWYGEPENQLAVINHLKLSNIGIVYNFHHAENDIDRFPNFFPKILPHLYAINLMGLKGKNPAKVVPVGEGDQELEMMKIVKESGYNGPIGIINEDTHPDAEAGLKMNMDGVAKVVKQLGDKKALRTY